MTQAEQLIQEYINDGYKKCDPNDRIIGQTIRIFMIIDDENEDKSDNSETIMVEGICLITKRKKGCFYANTLEDNIVNEDVALRGEFYWKALQDKQAEYFSNLIETLIDGGYAPSIPNDKFATCDCKHNCKKLIA